MQIIKKSQLCSLCNFRAAPIALILKRIFTSTCILPFRTSFFGPIIATLLFSAISLPAFSQNPPDKVDLENQLDPKYKCTSTKEYITAIEYLRDRKNLGVDEKQARQIADQVSTGCTGAAQRFIRSFEVLNKVEIGATTARDVALVLSKTTDEISENFLSIFATSFVKNELDLSAQKSVQLAKALSYDYEGDFKVAKADFEKLIDFCKNSELALSLGKCGEFMVGVILNGAKFKEGIATAFSQAFKFLRENPQIRMAVVPALAMAKEIASTSPRAVENFSKAFEYAISKDGLDYDAKLSLLFARKMSLRTNDTRKVSIKN